MENSLDYFGEVLIHEVRDRTIRQVDMTISGKMKDEKSKKIYNNIKKMNKEQIELINEMIFQIVDLSIHNMLCMAEDSEKINVIVDAQCINEISDGLAGELYTEDGWIQRFSKERYGE